MVHKLPSFPFIVTFIDVQCAQYPRPLGLGSSPVKYPFLSPSPQLHKYFPGDPLNLRFDKFRVLIYIFLFDNFFDLLVYFLGFLIDFFFNFRDLLIVLLVNLSFNTLLRVLFDFLLSFL